MLRAPSLSRNANATLICLRKQHSKALMHVYYGAGGQGNTAQRSRELEFKLPDPAPMSQLTTQQAVELVGMRTRIRSRVVFAEEFPQQPHTPQRSQKHPVQTKKRWREKAKGVRDDAKVSVPRKRLGGRKDHRNGMEESSTSDLDPLLAPPAFNDVITENWANYPTGRPWKSPNVKPVHYTCHFTRRRGADRLNSGPVDDDEEEVKRILKARLQLLTIIGTSNVLDECWTSYTSLLSLHPPASFLSSGSSPSPLTKHPWIPYAHLHRLSRLLSYTHPKTRRSFLRHVSVLRTIRKLGGTVRLDQWNALIDVAGKGWRKAKEKDYLNALSVFDDLVEGREPGDTFLGTPEGNSQFTSRIPTISIPLIPLASPFPSVQAGSTPPPSTQPDLEASNPNPQPDIYTYTTLLSIASRTSHLESISHALSLFKSSGHSPNRITHLSTLKFFSLKTNLSGLRSTLHKMGQQRLELGLDGLNACLWAYARSHQVDLVADIYRILRHNQQEQDRQHRCRRSLNANPDSNSSNSTLTHEGRRQSQSDDVRPQEYKDVNPEDGGTEEAGNSSWAQATLTRLRSDENLIIPHGVVPNQITFTIVAQTFAYHGDLTSALTALIDMLSSKNQEVGAPVSYYNAHESGLGRYGDLLDDGEEEDYRDEDYDQDKEDVESEGGERDRKERVGMGEEGGIMGARYATYEPTVAIFRAIFLGFVRHGIYSPPPSPPSPPPAAISSHHLHAVKSPLSLLSTRHPVNHSHAPTNPINHLNLVHPRMTSTPSPSSGATFGPNLLRHHGSLLPDSNDGTPASSVSSSTTALWDYSNLGDIFEAFLDLPVHNQTGIPSGDEQFPHADGVIGEVPHVNHDRPIGDVERGESGGSASSSLPEPLRYWILIAFSRTTGEDLDVMRQVWDALEEKFGPPKNMVGPSNRLTKLRDKLFREEGYEY